MGRDALGETANAFAAEHGRQGGEGRSDGRGRPEAVGIAALRPPEADMSSPYPSK
jgi:hypothetical protein